MVQRIGRSEGIGVRCDTEQLSEADRKSIEDGLLEKYARVAKSPVGGFRYPVGEDGLRGLGYDEALLARLPRDVLASFCGVGNPFSLGPVVPGESVLDIGCGAGVDSLIAALATGKEGKVVGIDMIPAMLDRARENLRAAALTNVIFERASGEEIPFPDGSFHVVISNGVFNLIPDKEKALGEVLRVLKPGGRLMMADQVVIVEPQGDWESRVKNWAR